MRMIFVLLIYFALKSGYKKKKENHILFSLLASSLKVCLPLLSSFPLIFVPGWPVLLALDLFGLWIGQLVGGSLFFL